MLPIDAQSDKEDIRHVQEMLGVRATGDWDFVDEAKALAVRSGTGDPNGKKGTRVNGRMYTHLLEEFIKRHAPSPDGGLNAGQVKALIAESKIVP